MFYIALINQAGFSSRAKPPEAFAKRALMRATLQKLTNVLYKLPYKPHRHFRFQKKLEGNLAEMHMKSTLTPKSC